MALQQIKEMTEERKVVDSPYYTVIYPATTTLKRDDCIWSESLKQALLETIILPAKFPQLFTGRRQPWRGVLLFGTPHSGKKILLKAVAKEAELTLVFVDCAIFIAEADEKILANIIYTAAKHIRHSLLVLENIDIISRDVGNRRLLTELLVILDRRVENEDPKMIVGLTNEPWGMEHTLLKRFERRIECPPLDEPLRKVFLRTVGECERLSEAEISALASKSEG